MKMYWGLVPRPRTETGIFKFSATTKSRSLSIGN